MDLGITILLAVLGSSGLSAVIVAVLQHHWSKDNAVTVALKVLLIDRVRYLGRCYLKDGEIHLDDKEMLNEMYSAYKGLGGNGDLDIVMNEINKLQTV